MTRGSIPVAIYHPIPGTSKQEIGSECHKSSRTKYPASLAKHFQTVSVAKNRLRVERTAAAKFVVSRFVHLVTSSKKLLLQKK